MEEKPIGFEGKKAARPRGTDSAKVIQVIVTESLCCGGSKEDPARLLRQYWGMNGKLLAIRDYSCEMCPCFHQGRGLLSYGSGVEDPEAWLKYNVEKGIKGEQNN